MSWAITAQIDDRRVIEAFHRAPGVMVKHLTHGVDRAALEVSRTEKRETPKATSLLTNSVQIARLGRLSRLIGPTVDYGPMVNDGAGPGGAPPRQTLLDWIRTKRIQPHDPRMSEESLAFVIGRHIRQHGTPANPFADRTAEATPDRVHEIITAYAARGLQELGMLA